jgi:23S rRNA (guanosine2251-2'-O)-methyltransferase
VRSQGTPPPAPRRRGPRPVQIDAAEQVEGRQAVRELLRAGRRRVHHLTLADSSAHSGLLDEIVALAEEADVPVRWVGRDRLEAEAVTDAAQGVVAVADPIPEASIEDLVRRAEDGPAPFLVVLDGVTDPHNVGAVMRSALSAGATGMVVGRHRAAGLSPTAVKAAAGAVEWLPVAPVAGIPATLAELRQAGVWTVGLDAEGDRPLWGLEVATEPVALVLGAEGAGLSRLVRQRCEVVASIPMEGPLASLNVSAAATLACFEVSRRRTSAG